MMSINSTSNWMARIQVIAVITATVCVFVGCGKKQSTVPSPPSEVIRSESESVPESKLVNQDRTAVGDDDSIVAPLELDTGRSSPSNASSADGSLPVDEVPAEAIATRIADRRPDLNPARLQAAGIRMLQSKRLVLLTDLPEAQVAGLPEIADQLFDHLESHFGLLPSAIDDSGFQVTGCIIGDEARFHAAGLMPEAEFGFKYGRHREYQFWMMAPESDYYRRHLMLHEFTHCFMTCETTMLDIPPRWYIEGMAEFFATHKIDDNAVATFGILPESSEGYEGWGRISELDRLFQRTKRGAAVTEVCKIEPVSEVLRDVVWSEKESDYARWWAISWLLQSNEEYRSLVDQFKPLRRRDEFMAVEQNIRRQLGRRLAVDWLLVAESLEPGFDTERSFPVHLSNSLANGSRPESMDLQAANDWQQTGFRLKAGESVVVRAEGRISLSKPADQWVSEPQGISVTYERGFPVGRVVGTLVSADGSSVTHRFSIGRQATIQATVDSELWMQVNDSSASREGNSGMLKVSFFPQ